MAFLKKLSNFNTNRKIASLSNRFSQGIDIDGTIADSRFGRSISMNFNGDRIVIGADWDAYQTSTSTTTIGYARVYHYDAITSTWIQLGGDIDGEATDDLFGMSVSMNFVGDIIAIGGKANDVGGAKTNAGHVRVYRYDAATSNWIQLGGDIDGETAGDFSGSSISLNGAGDRIAIAAEYNSPTSKVNAGHVRVYRYDAATSNWIQLGTDIDGEAASDFSGRSISLNLIGDRVAIGAALNDVAGAKVNAGHTRIFSYNGTSWTQLGTDIDGESASDQSGCSVSMNAEGDRVVIGANYNSPTSKTNAGHVRVYRYNGSSWTQLGTDIDGEFANDQSGYSVSMSASGNKIIIGAFNNSPNGHARIFRFNGSNWIQVGKDINGETAGDNSGISVSMSGNGNRFAIGATLNDANLENINTGHVRIYYDYVLDPMNQIGETLLGEGSGDNFSASAYTNSMNSAGDVVAMSSYLNDVGGARSNAGHTRIFSYNGTSWTQRGADIDGEFASDRSGISISLNDAGTRIAIGESYWYTGATYFQGRVRVFSWNGSSWSQLGSSITGAAVSDGVGQYMSMSKDGNRIIVSITGSDANGTDSGQLKIYFLNGSTWTLLGSAINGKVAQENLGIFGTCANYTGDRIAAVFRYPANAAAYGVRVFSWNGSSWSQLGGDIIYNTRSSGQIAVISMNRAGDRIAIGSRESEKEIKVFSWDGSSWSQLGQTIPVNGFCKLNDTGNILVVSSPVFPNAFVNIYLWSGSSWVILHRYVHPTSVMGEFLSINSNGDRVLVGAFESGGTPVISNRGAARIFAI